jgi:hypothetical protein
LASAVLSTSASTLPVIAAPDDETCSASPFSASIVASDSQEPENKPSQGEGHRHPSEAGSASADVAGELQTYVLPRLHVLSPKYLRAGRDDAEILISLTIMKGGRPSDFKDHEDIVFNIEPVQANVSFFPSNVITIKKGANRSERIKLTAEQPCDIELACTPDQDYPGMRPLEPKSVQFIPPIDGIEIAPQSGDVQVNISRPFVLYLRNETGGVGMPMAPSQPVDVQLESENGNGKVVEPSVQLSAQKPSILVHYVGQRIGTDTIIARANYAEGPISGNATRRIAFPWVLFFFGEVGAVIGSCLRGLMGDPGSLRNRLKRAFEGLLMSTAFCVIVILFPMGTTLPQIGNFIQPGLMLVLTFLVSYLGTGFLKLLLSFLPKSHDTAAGG